MSAKSARKSTRPRRSAPARATRATPGLADAALPPGFETSLFDAMSLRVARGAHEHRLTGPEIERALLSGEHGRTLETYFGEAEYAELRQLAAQATRRTRHPGPRVLILPGILGSMIAQVNGKEPDTIWVDFIDIMLGRLARLKLPDTTRTFRAVDVHHSTYLNLKLSLQAEGFSADFHPYDWRQSIPDLGRELARRIAADPAPEIILVAHSMGGLVSRAAIHHGAGGKIKRLVMLGTPNFGSFAPAMVYRSAYPFLNNIARLDLKRSATELAGEIFNTHPGLAQLLPQRSKFDAIDLYDLEKWPLSGARPLQPVLTRAVAAQQEFAVEPEKFVMIAGVDHETTVGISLADGNNEFIFERSRAGDGTVPLDLAVLPNVLTYYHAEEHGALPKNSVVQKAVVEILRTGATTLLSDRWARTRADAAVQVSETELRARFAGQLTRGVSDFSASDLRGFMAEFAAPAKPFSVQVGPSSASGASSLGADVRPWESLVVGRRRQRRIDVHLARGSLTQVKSRAYLLGIFQNVEPGGAALAIDNLMDGTLREFRQRRMFAAGAGEVLLMPTGRSEVTAEHVVFVGLGHFDAFNLQLLETVAENVARTLARMDVEEFATVPIGAGTGFDVESALRALLRGFFRGLDDADSGHDFRRITFCEVDESRFEQLKWTLYRLWSTPLCEGVEVTLKEEKLPPAPVTRRRIGAGIPPCIYLNVRTHPEKGGGRIVFESSLLTTGAKATVLSGAATVDARELAALLAEIEDRKFNHEYLGGFGRRLAALVLNDSVAAGLEGTAGNHLVIVHDAEGSRVPWETLCLDGVFPALTGGMSRRYLADDLSVAKWLEQRRRDDWLDVLLVVDPTEDLSGAVREGRRIEELFTASQQVHLTVVRGKAATRARLRAEFASGKYDILHYAGHAYFDPGQTARSGIVCSDGNLVGTELVELGNLPSLVFFNACESARVRTEVKRESPRVTRDIQERIQRNAGLAEAFMRGGVANYIGTYWPVGDAPAETFAAAFYQRVIEGGTISSALAIGRTEVEKLRSADWADYIFYGSIDFTVKKPDTDQGT